MRKDPLIGLSIFFCLTLCLQAAPPSPQEETGAITGQVLLQINGVPLHNVHVILAPVGTTSETDENGRFEFRGLPPGLYDVTATSPGLGTEMLSVTVSAGMTAEVNFHLSVGAHRTEVTVTARGHQQTAFEAVQSVHSLDSFDIAEKMATSLGEVLEGQTGVSKRSFGPGNTRPIIRGFDGDRVLVMQDGMRVGSLGSQSGDHSEPIDPISLERIEVVKGPATLLYGSNAVGGVVNAISGHHEVHQQAHEGIRAQISSAAGSNGGQAAASANAEYGTGNWMFWVGGGGQRSGDYHSPEGTIENSKTRISNASAGLGWYGEKAFSTFEYMFNEGRYGIPFANQFHGHGNDGEEDEQEELEAVDLDFDRNSFRVNGGLRNLNSFIESVRLSLDFTHWNHREVESLTGGVEEIATTFNNDQFVYRGMFEQAKRGALSGSFGFWGLARNYKVVGEEALSPPVDQNAMALFAVEEFEFERLKLQFGGRLEHTRYDPRGPFERVVHHEGELEEGAAEEVETVFLPQRRFTGLSGGIGVRLKLADDMAFVANFTSSHRAPALEELYNFGPHIGNLAFEIGNSDLSAERTNGIDFSLRHESDRLRGEANLFYYHIGDFVFLAPTGEIEDGLIEAQYSQADSRFFGVEAEMDLALVDDLWLNLGLSTVDADLIDLNTPLPRIPPVKGRIGLDFRQGGFSVRPELVLSRPQESVFPTETATAGYGVVNLTASYTLPAQHFVHHFSVNVFNAGDRLYRNHTSFIKELAPEMGRGVRFSYAMKYF